MLLLLNATVQRPNIADICIGLQERRIQCIVQKIFHLYKCFIKQMFRKRCFIGDGCFNFLPDMPSAFIIYAQVCF